MIKTIIKRDGTEAIYDEGKIIRAIYKAMLSVKIGTMKDAEEVAKIAVREVSKVSKKPTVEQIQDKVETALMTYRSGDQSFVDVAKAYILYRERRRIIRDEKASIGVKDDLKLSLNAIKVLEARYLLKDEEGKIIETPRQMFRRVASHVGVIDALYEYRTYQITGKLPENGRKCSPLSKTQIEVLKRGFDELSKEGQIKGKFDEFMDFLYTKPTKFEENISEYEEMMLNLEYVPNSPTMMNAGARLGQLSACFVLPVDDSVDGIFNALKYTAEIHKSGGGTGFSFSRLRGKDDIVGSTKGVASGPVSFMRIFDTTTDVIKQGGKRRGANMGILRYDHPDIMEFILNKDAENTILSNFNISVGMTDEFFEKLDSDGYVELRNPRDGKITGRIKATTMWDSIINQAWKTADPGLIFLDEINKKNPVAHIAEIEATNPCITGDTGIFTVNGIRKAKDLYLEGNPVDVVTDSRISNSRIQHASNVIMTGVKPVFKLKTKEGFRIRLTADHLVYSDKRGWINAGNLRAGERILVANNGGGFGQDGSLAEGRVLGWLAGDGHINMGNGNKRAIPSFYGKDISPDPQFSEYVNEITSKSVKNGVYEVNVASSESRNLSSISPEGLKEHVIQERLGENKFKVPAEVMSGSEEMQRGFIQALFEAAGTVSLTTTSTLSVRLASNSENLLEEVQMLLLNFGIFSRVYSNRKGDLVTNPPGSARKPKAYGCKTFHELVISGRNMLRYSEQIGSISKRKQEKLDEIAHSNGKVARNMKWLATVASIEPDGTEEVFDLVEPNSHSFIANGLVIHNCGEQPLMPYESCNLGSINLEKFVKDGDIDYERLRNVIRLSTKFLDNVVDANKFPVVQIKNMTRKTRKIGLGVMGFADMLIRLGIPYNSGDALVMGERIMAFLQDESHEESKILAEERGVFPGWYGSKYEEEGIKMRNSTTTTIAPTGTISIIAGCSSSIEPLFAIAFVRHVLNGQELIEVNPLFEEMLRAKNLYSEDLMREVAKSGNLHGIDIDPEIKRLFVTAHEIEPEWHVLMQATFQRYCDSGVSKTINLPSDASPEDIGKAYRMAKDLHCKGITVYRDQSKTQQVLYTGTATRKDQPAKVEKKPEKKVEKKETEEVKAIELIAKLPEKYLKLDSTFDPACPTGKCDK